MKNDPNSDINELILTGMIVSEVRCYKKKCVYTLENGSGRFFVQWPDPEWHPERGQRVMVRGEIYSIVSKSEYVMRIRANSVTILQVQN